MPLCGKKFEYLFRGGVIKKTLISIVSFIIFLTFFVGTAQAQVCLGSYVIDGANASYDISLLSGCTGVSGSLTISGTALTSLSGLENITSVGGMLKIEYNNVLTSLSGLENLTSVGDLVYIYHNNSLPSLSGLENLTSEVYLTIYDNAALTSLTGLNNITSAGGRVYIDSNNSLLSLSGLDNITSVGGTLEIDRNDVLLNLCALYDVYLSGWKLHIYENTLLSTDTANALLTQLQSNGFSGTITITGNNGSGLVACPDCADGDGDGDGVCEDIDNCPLICNSDQLDADGDGDGDVCDASPGCGGVSCGVPQPECEESCGSGGCGD
jgi:hypothetical protein